MGVSSANEQGISGTRNPASLAPAVAAFYSHLRDVYYRAWRQPVTQNTGHTAILKIRLDREGNILNSVLVSPSGNAAMDESVRSAARAVTRLGRPLPDELAGETVEVSITFEY
jgi:TonB family protein